MTTEIKCTNCGTINVGELMRCRLCNHPLHFSETELRECPQCRSTVTPIGKETCISCGWNFATTHQEPPEETKSVKPAECEYPEEAELHTVRSFSVELAVIFMLLAGGLGIMHALLAALPDTSPGILSNYGSIIPQGKFLNDVLQDHVYISLLMFVFGALSIGLSMTALKRSNYAGAVAGAVFGILSIGFLFGAFFGLMALILLAISKREFLLECI
jgi:predicted anti-sigma-YlaC factor YlaD